MAERKKRKNLGHEQAADPHSLSLGRHLDLVDVEHSASRVCAEPGFRV
jgi:hypothetical protein